MLRSSFTQLEYDEDDEEGDTNLNAQSVPDIRGEDEPPLDDEIESEPTFEISVVIRKGEVSVLFLISLMNPTAPRCSHISHAFVDAAHNDTPAIPTTTHF